MKNHLLPLALMLSGFTLSAHNGSINGRVTESGSGLELPGVTVRLEPGNQRATTNTLGFFGFTNECGVERSAIRNRIPLAV